MKHNSLQGPQPTGVAIYGQFPVLWAWLSGEQILGLDLPGEWVLGLDLSLGGPLPLPLSSPIAVNISTKWKRKRQKKKKISSLEATGSLRGPASPSFLRSRAAPLGLAARTSLCTCASPARVGRPPEQLFTIQRQKKNLDTTAKQRTRFLPSTCFCRLFPCSACPWHQSALLGRVPHCLPQDWGLSSPLPTGPGEAPHTPKDAFAKMAVLSL